MNTYELEFQIKQILDGRHLMPFGRVGALLKLCRDCYEEGWNDALEDKEMIDREDMEAKEMIREHEDDEERAE